jgi:formylglycine-generating enzyme required for sulfatase activity
MADQVRVFVSHHHSRKEDAFTARLVTDLEAAGADVWVDTAGIASDDFVKKINEGLADRQWLVLVMTPAAVTSPWVQREVNVALNEHTAGRMLGVLPLMMQPCQEQNLPMLWRTLYRYDATHDYTSARDGLLQALGLRMPTIPQPRPAPQQRPPASPAAVDEPDLPPRLVQLGFAVHRTGIMEYVLPKACDVPAGPFLMGSDRRKDKSAFDDEKPRQSVTLDAFQISMYPVTVAEYACFIRSTRTAAPTGNDGQIYEVGWQTQLRDRPDHPVVRVSWHDATAYAAWLANVTGESWRLPTEAEWEKAARGTDGRIFPWGDSFDVNYCNTAEAKKESTTPVGSYPAGASPCFALDMAGNVFEWTSSVFKPYPSSLTDGRERPESTEVRVLRGGSWRSGARHARAAYRNRHNPEYVSSSVGFRLARSVTNS